MEINSTVKSFSKSIVIKNGNIGMHDYKMERYKTTLFESLYNSLNPLIFTDTRFYLAQIVKQMNGG